MAQLNVDGEQTTTWSIEDLLRHDAFPHAADKITLRETHISWVVLTGEFAYKIKKPVKLDFIDASSLEQRRRFCEEELRLNRRLAPELYLGLVPINRRQDGHAVVDGDGTAIDYAVKMRQFSASDELPVRLARNEVTAEEIAALGEQLARFHMQASLPAPAQACERTEQMYEVVLGNLDQLIARLETIHSPQVLRQLFEWTRDNANRLELIFDERDRSGFVRECHGDLHAANIVRSEGRLTAFDCIDFDPKLRWIDVMNDLAFLVMDLASHQHGDLAYVLLSRYLEVTGDYQGLAVLPFYAVYRALVRAKVDAMSAELVPDRAEEFRQRLEQRLHAAVNWTRPRRAMLVLMHGPSGSGKSWLSGRLVPELHAVRVRSDLERKRLAGLTPTHDASAAVNAGIYSQELNHRTYSRLADCADSALRAGISVIVDAAFLQQSDRTVFCSLASRLGLPFVIVSCQADPATLAARITERSRARRDPSDANVSVLDSQLRTMQPFNADEQSGVVSIKTGQPGATRRVADQIRVRCTG